MFVYFFQFLSTADSNVCYIFNLLSTADSNVCYIIQFAIFC